MFYSQFILAKKGPLGTIWIAAHLERKLRKNQVADTDIGVSVDSILFPEAPIALRLSSHLLLGVVRIYSRKVNYLFHDCSEALLKVKQAFRSTAVDLPPEESTAPYHSITVPETFHLDDFELPDSAYGNYVDHHISTKEQITLQDNMNTTGCSTSQFGLDERFGDGDASHIGLDLEEDLLLGTAPPPHSFGSEHGAIHQDLPSVPVFDMDIDESEIVYDEGCGDATPKDFSGFASNDNDKHIHSCTADSKEHDGTLHRHGYNPRTPDLNVVFTPDIPIEDSSYNVPLGFGADDVASPDIAEFAQAPSTPGLMEEVIPANYQEMPTSSPQQKSLPSSNVDAEAPLTTCPQCPNATQSNELLHAVCSPTSLLSGPCGPLLARDDTHPDFGQKSPDSLQNGFICNEKNSLQTAVQVLDNGEAATSLSTGLDGFLSNSCSLEASDMVKPLDKCLDTPDQVVQTSDLPNASKLVLEEASKINGIALSDEAGELIPAVELIPNSENCVQEADPCPLTTNTSALSSGILSLQDGALVGDTPDISIGEPSSHIETPKGPVLHVHGSSTALEGGESPSANVIDGGLGVHANTETALSERNLGDSKQDYQSTGVVSKEAHLDHLNCSSSSEFPEPEKMVLAPIGDMSFPNDLGQLTTEKGVTESDGSVDRMNKVSGRKRHLTESTPVLQTCSSAKLPGRPRLKRNSEYVPDDDDLLASILVGRRTALRMGPTPPALKVSSLKRPRLTPKVGMSKRKVQLDDSTVLHADAIRQQLINTEDIRRIRKKAPCTRPEIWMIEQCSREEEIFDECLLTGISAAICNLHTRSYAIDVIRGSQGESHSHVEQAEGVEHLRSSEVDREEGGEQVELQSNKLDIQISRNNGNFILSATEMDEMHTKNSGLDVSLFSASHLENEAVASPNGVITGASNHRNITNDSCPEKDDDIYKQAEQSSGLHLDNPLDESMELNDRTVHLCESLPSEAAISAEGTARDRIVDDISVSSGNDKNLVTAEVLNDARGISTIEEGRGQIFDEAVRLDHHQGFHSIVENTENGGTMLDNSLLDIRLSSPDVLVETFQLDAPTTFTDNHLIEETKQVHLDVTVDDELATEKVTNNEKGSPSEMVCSESIQVVASVCVEPTTEIENIPSAVGENSGLQEFCQEGGVDVESTPMDFSVAREFSDFSSAIDGNDTDFLNVDDEADFDEADIDVPNPEETQSFENSGWSSRTRGVARYLKSLFDDEYGRGKKVVAMDNLIAGKTRKEASRMFFETLVLKTRDYIDVEQEKPLDYVNIKPRTKLLKTEF